MILLIYIIVIILCNQDDVPEEGIGIDKEGIENDEDIKQKMADLKKEVNDFALQFPMPGFGEY